jgi:ABC-type spermidine/putrescine transport system permease subunit I
MVILGRYGLINRTLLASGFIDQPIVLLNTKLAVVLGLTHVMLPYMTLPLYASIVSIDKDLPQAARGLGASAGKLLLYIYLPLTRNGILAGATLTFVLSLGYYIVPAILGGGKVMMLATIIEAEIHKFLNWNFAAALSAVLLFTTALAVGVLNYTNRERARSSHGESR